MKHIGERVTFIPAMADSVNHNAGCRAAKSQESRDFSISGKSRLMPDMDNPYRQTFFLLGTPDSRRAPPDQGAEVAFAGRSNAGKSSALNTITGQRSLARISKAPGRTREINFFQVTDDRRLVDLPGYGYAKVSRTIKADWQKNIARYLETRRSLCGVILLMDVRHPLKDQDCQVISWCNAAGLPTHVLLTKADKLKRGPANAALHKTRDQLAKLHPGATIQLFSSHTRSGTDTVLGVLNDWLGLPEEDNSRA
ncbi:MAG: ribosome biogenesis GTP-binding protein YihA/YsxC [Gammaproteobacteria bacterium]